MSAPIEGILILRNIAIRFVTRHRRATAALSAASTLAVLAAIGPAPASAAGSGPTGSGPTGSGATSSGVTIQTSYENNPISLGTSDAIGYALTNDTGLSQTVTFTDNLPTGVQLDSPIAATNTAGTGTCTLAPPDVTPGASAFQVSVTVPSELASGPVCTISFGIVATIPSAADAPITDTYSGVSATTVTPTTTAGSLIVLTNPTLSFTAPSNGQSFYLGQIDDASFACAPTDPLDSIDSFFGTDDAGNQIESGAPIDTVDPGSHTLEVDCYSAAGGGEVSQTVTYTVGSFALDAVREIRKTDVVSFQTLVPAGKIVAKVIYGKKVLGTTTQTTISRATASVAIKPTASARRLLAALRGRSASVKLQVAFTPQAIGSGDQQITPAGAIVVTRNIRLPIGHAARRRLPHRRRQQRGRSTARASGLVRLGRALPEMPR
jgi:hypothetical protein